MSTGNWQKTKMSCSRSRWVWSKTWYGSFRLGLHFGCSKRLIEQRCGGVVVGFFFLKQSVVKNRDKCSYSCVSSFSKTPEWVISETLAHSITDKNIEELCWWWEVPGWWFFSMTVKNLRQITPLKTTEIAQNCLIKQFLNWISTMISQIRKNMSLIHTVGTNYEVDLQFCLWCILPWK